MTFLLFSSSLFAQSLTERDATDLFFARKYQEARKAFRELAKQDPNSAVALYGLAISTYEYHKQLMQEEAFRNKYKDFQPHFDLLAFAYEKGTEAARVYSKLSPEEQDQVRKAFSTTDTGITKELRQEIQIEAFRIVKQAPYRKNLLILYGSQIYDRVTDADTVDVLREKLVYQCNQYLRNYPNSPFKGRILGYRYELLLDYTKINSLRQFGDRRGQGYEKFCDLIIEQYSKEEVQHIVPRFYGAEFGFDESDYTEHPNYRKLKKLAEANNRSVIQLLCDLNLHFEGYSEENKELYPQFIEAFAPMDIAYVAMQRMAAPHIQKSEWREAFNIFYQFLSLFPDDPRPAQVMRLLRKSEGQRQIRNLGSKVNSEYDDYSPVLSLDGQTLYFARRSGETGEDIFVSEKNAQGQWQEAQPLSSQVNTQTHEIPMGLNAKGDKLFIYGNYSSLENFNYVLRTEPLLGKGDMYYAEKTWRGWLNLDALKSPVNTPHYEATLSITADEQALLFCSDRPGAVGGYNPNYPEGKLYFHGSGEFNTDLYVSPKTEGGWGKPINLGPTINTPYAERYPFLHPDGETLYFISDGHYGLGGYDIFMSKRLNPDSWTEWSEPVNLGKTLNSAYDDSFYITALGTTALVVSNKEQTGFGRQDIYEIQVPAPVRPEPIYVVSGKVQDLDGSPVETEIKWADAATDMELGSVKTDKATGQYLMPLKGGKKYVYYAEDPKYFGTSVTVDVRNPEEPKVSDREIEVSSFEKKAGEKAQPFVMKTLHFDHNSDVIREESFYDLKRLADMIKRHPSVKLRIEGHTDSVGSDSFNQDLSERRAQSVKRFLSEQGVSAGKLSAQGFGESRPVADNDTEKGKQANRRVEFYVE